MPNLFRTIIDTIIGRKSSGEVCVLISIWSLIFEGNLEITGISEMSPSRRTPTGEINTPTLAVFISLLSMATYHSEYRTRDNIRYSTSIRHFQWTLDISQIDRYIPPSSSLSKRSYCRCETLWIRCLLQCLLWEIDRTRRDGGTIGVRYLYQLALSGSNQKGLAKEDEEEWRGWLMIDLLNPP